MLTHCARVNQPGRYGLPENKRLGKRDYLRGESKLTTRGHVRNIPSALVLRSYNTPCFDNPEFGSIDLSGSTVLLRFVILTDRMHQILSSRELLNIVQEN